MLMLPKDNWCWLYINVWTRCYNRYTVFSSYFSSLFLSLMPLLLLWRRRRWRQWLLSSKRIFSIYVIAIFPRMHQQCIAKGYSYRSNTHLFTYVCVLVVNSHINTLDLVVYPPFAHQPYEYNVIIREFTEKKSSIRLGFEV